MSNRLNASHGGHSMSHCTMAAERGCTAAYVSAMSKLRQRKQSSIMEEYWRAQLHVPTMVFSRDKVVHCCSVVFVHACAIERCTKPLLGLYLDSRGSSYQKPEAQSQSTVPLHWDSCFSETILLPSLARHTPQSKRKRRSGELAYSELCQRNLNNLMFTSAVWI